MSKNLIRPSDIRAGLQDIEMAEDTVNLVYQNLISDQAHLKGDPIDVKSLPEQFQGITLRDNDDVEQEDEGEDSMEDEPDFDEIDPLEELQDFLDDLGSQMLARLKRGDKIKKIWPGVSLSIQNFVKTKFMFQIPEASSEDKATQTEMHLESSTKKLSVEVPKETPRITPKETKKSDIASVEGYQATDEEAEAEVAHQIGESFAKKYKFPSRSAGIFLWNFEQLKMNLDDIVQTAMELPGVADCAKDGKRLPLRGVLGYVGLKHSKKFQLLVNHDKMGQLIQKDLDTYTP
ncbi:phosphoprotein [Lleida bat lyssavirus]|uniref:Phosphoprotein n=1 Tax=Lleida bat lyssavirus TaxID=1213198 RepID=A0A1I9RGZ7_9RHAB|nr:phosphoprotein [Lleida bat lyssavirus]AOZ21304.1 phosphoprotein [Lleida bat lyssavirus]AZB73863.1 phosphoprotein [Lleida bat lyssavirus]